MRVRPSLPLWTLLIALLATFSSSVWATESDVQGGSEQVFRAEELDQMLAPLALYPDTLLAQVLMASTYPGDVADAASWSMEHPDASGDDAVRQVSEQPWDPSVQSLVAFPAVLATLGQDPAWVQRVGDAFLAQPDAVMDSVQRLRHQAREAGNLESNDKQKVSELPAETTQVSTSSGQQTIIIEPADPQVVYVPSYNPTVVYGTWPYPSYPPVYYPPTSRLLLRRGADGRPGVRRRRGNHRFIMGRLRLGPRRHRHRRGPLQQHQQQPTTQRQPEQLAAQRQQPRRRTLS